jgi:two-component system, chemotaxis family, protein-glutamate methylesterase/glutaminase
MTEQARGYFGEAEQPGRPVPISCPDCSGGMRVVETGQALHYRCHIGHVWAPAALVSAQQDKIEHALWTAVSILEERAAIHEKLAERAAGGAASRTGSRQRAMAAEVRTAAEVIRKHFPDLVPEVS